MILQKRRQMPPAECTPSIIQRPIAADAFSREKITKSVYAELDAPTRLDLEKHEDSEKIHATT
jgi:hypothetical protein